MFLQPAYTTLDVFKFSKEAGREIYKVPKLRPGSEKFETVDHLNH